MIRFRGAPLFAVAALAAALAGWNWQTAAGGAEAADTPLLELVQTIGLKGKAGNLDHLALDTKRDRLLLANKTNNSMDVVDLKAGKALAPVTGQGGIQGIAYAADLDRIFAGLGTGGYCNVFNAEDYKPLKTIKFKDDADNVRYNPRNGMVYVAHAEKELGVIDAKTYAVKTNIKLPGAAEGFEIEKERPRLYVNIPSPSQVAVIDTDKNEVVKNYPVKMAGEAHPLALDEANHRIFIGCRKEPKLVVLDSESGKEITAVPIPGNVDDLAFDVKAKRLFATCGEGSVAVIRQMDADHYELQEKVPTAAGAKTSLYVPETGKLYLAVPRQPGKEGPEIRVYQVRR